MFSRIFWCHKRKKQSNCFQANLKGPFLDQASFHVRLRQERLRWERSGLPLSVIIIDVVSLLDLLLQKTGVSNRRIQRHLANILENSTRESDVKGWYETGRISLLAPDTDESGAQTLVANLLKRIMSYRHLNADVPEHELRPFICISSLQSGRSYLSGANKGFEGKPVCYFSQQGYRSEHPPIQLAESLGSSGTVDVAVPEWPFPSEIMRLGQMRNLQIKVKRVVDIIGSLIGILLSAPLMLIIAALIKFTSPGPVLFRQQRLGLLGKPFTFLKFRSMMHNCDPSLHKDYVTQLIRGENDAINKGSAETPLYKIIDDPRITPFGKFLRKSSLDELPQFINVLKGDMSLVGPRPPIPYEYERYERWHCRRVLEVKPGITGLWQVSGRSCTTFDKMIRLDLTYVRTWNLWLDLKILLRTFWAVISTKGGY